MRIIAFGDIHMQTGKLAAISGLGSADLVLVTGDLTNFGGRREALTVINAIRAFNPRLLAVPGNLDRPEVFVLLAEEDISLHGQGRLVEQVAVIGVGGSGPTPFATPSEFSEEQLAALLAAGHAQTHGSRPLLLVSHTPPADTRADRLENGGHAGSRAVREFINQAQPALCLTGHIHEARSVDRIGGTLILNPGMLQTGGWIDIKVDQNGVNAELRP